VQVHGGLPANPAGPASSAACLPDNYGSSVKNTEGRNDLSRPLQPQNKLVRVGGFHNSRLPEYLLCCICKQ
jgi:hypothetical protein